MCICSFEFILDLCIQRVAVLFFLELQWVHVFSVCDMNLVLARLGLSCRLVVLSPCRPPRPVALPCPALAWPGQVLPCLAWPGLARPGEAWRGLAWLGLAWPGLGPGPWPGPGPGPGPALAWSGLAWPGHWCVGGGPRKGPTVQRLTCSSTHTGSSQTASCFAFCCFCVSLCLCCFGSEFVGETAGYAKTH